jgi:hypothetical protein
MALLEDVLENSFPGVVIGAVAAAVLLPLVGARRAATAGAAGATTLGSGVARPLMKAAVRGYLAVADTVKEVTAEAREQMSDLVAEVREERRMAEDEAPNTAPSPGPTTV